MLHVLLINKGSRATRVDLRLAGSGPAAVQRLLAPSAVARSRVTLGGQRLGPGDTWRGRTATELVPAVANGYELNVPGFSAALMSVHL
jgi:hypothetical protein